MAIDILAELARNTVEVGECLEWTGRYGTGLRNRVTPLLKRRVDGKRCDFIIAREVWRHYKGEPGKRIVYRKCCNPRCVALEHLAIGNQGDHLKRRAGTSIAKHSQSTIAAIALGRRRNCKYKPEQVAQARELIADGLSCAEIGRRIGMHADMVRDIKGGRAWRDTAPAGSVWTWRP